MTREGRQLGGLAEGVSQSTPTPSVQRRPCKTLVLVEAGAAITLTAAAQARMGYLAAAVVVQDTMLRQARKKQAEQVAPQAPHSTEAVALVATSDKTGVMGNSLAAAVAVVALAKRGKLEYLGEMAATV